MAVPTPYTAVSGTKITATAVNLGYRDPLNFLMSPPRVGAYQNGAGTTLVNGTLTGPLLFDAETEDTDTMHSTSSNTGRITFTTAGRYMINIYVMIATTGSPTVTLYSVNPRLNAAGSPSGGTSIRTFDFRAPGGASLQQTVCFSRVFNAADYIEVYVNQTSGANRVTDFGAGLYCTGIQAVWVGTT